MKYKIRYTFMALVLCGLLGWDLSYEYQKPDLVATAATPHPTVRSIKHLIAPAYVPPQTATTTGTGTATTTPAVASSTIEMASSSPSQSNAGTSSTPINILNSNTRPSHGNRR